MTEPSTPPGTTKRRKHTLNKLWEDRTGTQKSEFYRPLAAAKKAFSLPLHPVTGKPWVASDLKNPAHWNKFQALRQWYQARAKKKDPSTIQLAASKVKEAFGMTTMSSDGDHTHGAAENANTNSPDRHSGGAPTPTSRHRRRRTGKPKDDRDYTAANDDADPKDADGTTASTPRRRKPDSRASTPRRTTTPRSNPSTPSSIRRVYPHGEMQTAARNLGFAPTSTTNPIAAANPFSTPSRRPLQLTRPMTPEEWNAREDKILQWVSQEADKNRAAFAEGQARRMEQISEERAELAEGRARRMEQISEERKAEERMTTKSYDMLKETAITGLSNAPVYTDQVNDFALNHPTEYVDGYSDEDQKQDTPPTGGHVGDHDTSPGAAAASDLWGYDLAAYEANQRPEDDSKPPPKAASIAESKAPPKPSNTAGPKPPPHSMPPKYSSFGSSSPRTRSRESDPMERRQRLKTSHPNDETVRFTNLSGTANVSNNSSASTNASTNDRDKTNKKPFAGFALPKDPPPFVFATGGANANNNVGVAPSLGVTPPGTTNSRSNAGSEPSFGVIGTEAASNVNNSVDTALSFGVTGTAAADNNVDTAPSFGVTAPGMTNTSSNADTAPSFGVTAPGMTNANNATPVAPTQSSAPFAFAAARAPAAPSTAPSVTNIFADAADSSAPGFGGTNNTAPSFSFAAAPAPTVAFGGTNTTAAAFPFLAAPTAPAPTVGATGDTGSAFPFAAAPTAPAPTVGATGNTGPDFSFAATPTAAAPTVGGTGNTGPVFSFMNAQQQPSVPSAAPPASFSFGQNSNSGDMEKDDTDEQPTPMEEDDPYSRKRRRLGP